MFGLCITGNIMAFRDNLTGLRYVLLSFANYAFIVMVLVVGLNGIKEEDEAMMNGWYGQTGVLLFLTCLIAFIKSLVFSYWLSQRIRQAQDDDKRAKILGALEGEEQEDAVIVVP